MGMFNFDSIRNMNTLIQKKEKILKRQNNERLVLIGGSSVLYGFNTDLLSEKMDINSVNFGVNVGLGFDYLLEHIEPNLKKGDIVLLPLEFNQYTNPPYYVFGFGIDLFLKHIFFQRRKLYKNKLKLFLISLKHARTSSTTEKIKRRHSATFGKTGCYLDLNTQIREASTLKQLKFPRKFSETETMKEIKKFINRSKRREIRVEILPPAFYSENIDKDNSYLKELYEYFGYFDMDIEGFLLESNEIYDSVYHANSKGQKKITNKLIEFLQEEKEGNRVEFRR